MFPFLAPTEFRKGFRSLALIVSAIAAITGTGSVVQAQTIEGCLGCVSSDCEAAAPLIPDFHNKPSLPSQLGLLATDDYIMAVDLPGLTGWFANFRNYRTWLTTNGNPAEAFPDNFFRSYFLRGLAIFTEQMSAVALEQAMMIGQFFDAKHQLETQRLLQELQHQAHKDYVPSEDYCWFGTNIRSMVASEKVSRETRLALGQAQMQRHLAHGSNTFSDSTQRWGEFTSKYCDPRDNNWTARLTGLASACGRETPPDAKKTNIDIDYARLVEEPRTIGDGSVGDLADVMALSKNLYGSDTLTRNLSKRFLLREQSQHLYMALRSIAAKRGVAENSFNAIVAMKTSGTSNKKDTPDKKPATAKFLGALMQDLGVPTKEIYVMLGDNPSYYAQLEILAKKIYENPDFYSNLYDTPANVLRKSAALKAIDLIVDREMYDSELRQEMMLSVWLTSGQGDNFRRVNDSLININKSAKKKTP